MRAALWKDRESGMWCSSIDGGEPVEHPTWDAALAEVLGVFRVHRLAGM